MIGQQTGMVGLVSILRSATLAGLVVATLACVPPPHVHAYFFNASGTALSFTDCKGRTVEVAPAERFVITSNGRYFQEDLNGQCFFKRPMELVKPDGSRWSYQIWRFWENYPAINTITDFAGNADKTRPNLPLQINPDGSLSLGRWTGAEDRSNIQPYSRQGASFPSAKQPSGFPIRPSEGQPK